MKRRRIGCGPPRYAFMLNPYAAERISRCPKCRRLTHARKFALFILVAGAASPMVLGKTCRYCARCELIVAHKRELEGELARGFEARQPDVIGNDYFVSGTVERRTWLRGLHGSLGPLDEALRHVADFKTHYDLHIDPGGWRPAGPRAVGA
jgi:hypothetical protein